MGFEQKWRDLGSVKGRYFRNHRQWWRLVGRCAGLGWCHNVVRRGGTSRTAFAPTAHHYPGPRLRLESRPTCFTLHRPAGFFPSRETTLWTVLPPRASVGHKLYTAPHGRGYRDGRASAGAVGLDGPFMDEAG